MTTLHYVKKARKANKAAGIKKGESYYWWQFAFSQKQCSKTRPRRSQYMTRSETLGQIYDLEDQINDMTVGSVDSSCLDDIKSEIENLRDEVEEKRSNMPEQLQDSGSGEILQQYYDGLDSWLDALESVDFSPLDEDFEAAAKEEISEGDYTDEEGFDKEAYDKAVSDRAKELEEEAQQSVLDEIQACNYEG